MTSFHCLGLMSGTSMDGIDAVLVTVSKLGHQTRAHTFHSYSAKLREQLFAAIHRPELSLEAFGALDIAIGEAFAQAAKTCLLKAQREHGIKKIDVIGSHGQTVFHNPSRQVSLQLGSAAVIAARTGITTVHNFRIADILAGGEGAPLLPYYHLFLLGRGKSGFAMHNLGGISNFTYFGPQKKLIALDTGPANCWLDLAIQTFSGGKNKFDKNGARASRGQISTDLLKFIAALPDVAEYRKRPAPKSTGRELFSQNNLQKVLDAAHRLSLSEEDILSTLLEFTVITCVEAYERFVLAKRLPLREIIFCGGGAKNPELLRRIAQALSKCKISTLDAYGLAPEYIEAQAFGCYGLMAVVGKAQNLPQATGAKKAVVGGEITPGKNWGELYQKIYRASPRSVSNLL